jgi:hypothetical protein
VLVQRCVAMRVKMLHPRHIAVYAARARLLTTAMVTLSRPCTCYLLPPSARFCCSPTLFLALLFFCLFSPSQVAGDFDCATEQCEELVATMAKVYRTEHPMLGLQLYTLGNLYHAQKDYKAAVEPLAKAYANLSTYMGHEHPMAKGLHEMLKDARRGHGVQPRAPNPKPVLPTGRQ